MGVVLDNLKFMDLNFVVILFVTHLNSTKLVCMRAHDLRNTDISSEVQWVHFCALKVDINS